MPGDVRVRGTIVIPEAELRWRFSRSSGPGGQSVNTSDTRAEVIFDLQRSRALPAPLRARALARLGPRLVDGVLSVTASEQRSQWQNRTAAERRLALILAEAIAPPPPPRRATRPTRGAVERRIRAKKERGATKRLRQSTGDD